MPDPDEILFTLIELVSRAFAERVEMEAVEMVALETFIPMIPSVMAVETILTYKTLADRFSM